jgi:hypothetical protein
MTGFRLRSVLFGSWCVICVSFRQKSKKKEVNVCTVNPFESFI